MKSVMAKFRNPQYRDLVVIVGYKRQEDGVNSKVTRDFWMGWECSVKGLEQVRA
jgi:hypothetical protein